MSQNNIIVTNLYNIVSTSLSNKNNMNKLLIGIGKYMDKNSDVLYDIGLASKLLFLESDKEIIYEVCNLDKNLIKKTLKESEYIKSSWRILNEPLNTASVLILRYLAENKLLKELQLFITFYACYFYTSLHHKYLPYGANENVIAFTINNLTNKYKIKELGSLYKALEAIVMKSHETYEKELLRGNDADLAKYVASLKTRLNDFVKNIKNEYTKNYKDKRFMNYDSDDYSEDNYHIADNTSYAIERITQTTVIKLMTYGADMELISISAKLSQVNENELRNVITQLTDDEADKIRRLTELILQLYLIDNKNTIQDIRSRKFLINSLEIYKKSNTVDKHVLEIKDILDSWLKKYSDSYRKTNRQATLSNFRRALFIHFVLHLQASAS